ncbi:MAG: carboxypeptidase M32 [Caldilineaceae bacterium]|nr:carboxypeptidase M32 [Caldilineaceae bacterium]
MDKTTEKNRSELQNRLHEIYDLINASAVLSWDQATYMPPAGAASRGRQLATLGRLTHQKMTDPQIGRLLDALQPYADALPYEADDAALVRVTRRKYEEAIRMPSDFAYEFAEHASASFSAWAEARPANDFARMAPYLEKTLEMSRQYADFFPGYEHPADPLINQNDYGMKASTIRTLFSELRSRTAPLVQAIAQLPPVDNRCLLQYYPKAQQEAFGMEIAQLYGYDLQRGRQDETHHPFATRFSSGDVRITTRFHEHDLGDGLFSTLHETGHALYELGVAPELDATPLGAGTSSGVHESQSRLWENLVGRSHSFWNCFYPQLQQIFQPQLGQVEMAEFYRAINRVMPSLIRVEADEITYNLHVIIRFDLELALLDGTLSVAELPEAWHARYQQDLGVCAPNDSDGVLQDVHWYIGFIGGAFQGYSLGNILSAQFFDAAVAANPAIPAQIGQGQFDELHDWLRTNIYRHGAKFTTAELVQRVTGGPLSIEPYIAYLETKYSALYGLN